MSLDQHPELLTRVGKAMANAAVNEWTRITLDVTALRQMLQSELEITASDGSVDDTQVLDDDGHDACEELRAVMYQPGKGTWYNARFTLTSDGSLDSEFDYDNPPFDGDAEPVLLEFDQEKFPRDPENLPDWHPSRPTD